MKRLISLILCICMLISLIPAVSAGTDKSGITVKYRPWGPNGVLKPASDKYPLTNYKRI
ncbi:MAG: hypothetical protein IJ949_01625 [Oscillospiraceae bacterium]|nr:hypothetical protein [Oscillospiraceae bacterium]